MGKAEEGGGRRGEEGWEEGSAQEKACETERHGDANLCNLGVSLIIWELS